MGVDTKIAASDLTVAIQAPGPAILPTVATRIQPQDERLEGVA